MKRALFLPIAVVLAAVVALAQAAPAASGQAPTQAKPATPTAPAAQPAPTGPHPPQAKTQEEFKAYQDTTTKTTGADAEAAANDFVAKYPDSELRALAYRRALLDYQNEDNSDKILEIGRKIISYDKDSAEALVTVAGELARRTRETDLDRDDKLTEASNDAQHALQVLDGDLPFPATTPKEQVEYYRNLLRAMSYDALGTIALDKKDYPGAEAAYRKSTELGKAQPDAVTWLRLAFALDNQKKYADALDAASKAMQYAPQGSPVATMAKQEHDRLAQLAAPPAPKPQP